MHLKQIHQLGQFPRGVSIPPMNDSHMLDYMNHHMDPSNSNSGEGSSKAIAYPAVKTPGAAFNSGFGNGNGGGYEEENEPGKVSAFAALGLTEESYHMIIGDMMSHENGGFFGGDVMDSGSGVGAGGSGSGRAKRGVDDDGDEGGGKRPRFEEIVD